MYGWGCSSPCSSGAGGGKRAHLKALPPIIHMRLRYCCRARQKSCVENEDTSRPHRSSDNVQRFLICDANGLDRANRAGWR